MQPDQPVANFMSVEDAQQERGKDEMMRLRGGCTIISFVALVVMING
jgi:hypothetical protein